MQRPELSATLTPDEFAAWYWLKEELVDFCRRNRLPASGTKLDLQAEIFRHLAGAPPTLRVAQHRRSVSMPSHFTLQTVIGDGWRCGPALGAFFKQLLGSRFRFNGEMRNFIHRGRGKTLAEAAACYRASVLPGRSKAAIPSQLEYNRHFRDYFLMHPGASKEEAIAAWWVRRKTRTPRSSIEEE